jgi:hypothetical protein
MSFNQQFNNFRNKQLFQVNKDDITELSLKSAGDLQTFQKIDGNWLFAGMEAVDSVKMATYVNGLANVSGFDFADQFQPNSSQLLHQLEIKANNLMDELTITAYESNDTEKPFVVHSTLNPEAYFLSDSSGVYQKLFSKLTEVRSQ